MATAAHPLGLFSKIGLFWLLSLMATMAQADCVTDLRGEVYCGAGRCIIDRAGKVRCSRHYDGGALITLYGQVLCGKGQCAQDSHGQAFCSSEIGGAVAIDNRGRVRCYGRCEPATAGNCETTRAGGAEDKVKPDADRRR